MERLTEKGNYSKYVRKSHVTVCDVECKLGEYEQAEEDGLLIRLPCPIGTKVFCVMWGQSGWFVCEHEFEIRDLVEFGDSIFLTKAEAEQALAKMKGE